MTNKHGPTKSDLLFRLCFSAAGLVLIGAALYLRGLPGSAGGWEAIGIASVFFGGTFVWTSWKLLRRDYN